MLKLTGEVFLDSSKQLSGETVRSIISQLKQLSTSYQFGIVVGGGNIFRGSQHGKKLGLEAAVGHQIGMLATMMNGLILKDLVEQQELSAALFCAMPAPEIGDAISQQTIHAALETHDVLIFSGGTGNPFFTTDTNAILRALQMGADVVWKGTNVDGVYDQDPRANKNACRLASVSYDEAFNKQLGIMDMTAYALAYEHKKTVRVFDIFTKDALILVANNPTFGSIIQ
jgi:uridylate kinase